jgi:hypothetical protein
MCFGSQSQLVGNVFTVVTFDTYTGTVNFQILFVINFADSDRQVAVRADEQERMSVPHVQELLQIQTCYLGSDTARTYITFESDNRYRGLKRQSMDSM